MNFPEEELKAALKRAFSQADYIRFDGHSARNPFLSAGWNLAIERGWINHTEINLEQETILKWYITPLGKEALGLP